MQTVSRLIQTFAPDNYNLSLTLDRTGRTFKGTVTINGESMRGADDIRLHSKGLEIESVTYDGKEAKFSHEEFDELAITHPDIMVGKHVLVVAFSGKITDGMYGVYPCYYEHEGVKKELLATQFESHHAREVFPCIDEPAAKATFDVTLTTEDGVTVLGNMPIKDQRTENKQLVTTFDTTPRMSTYLLAWVVGELHKKSAKTKRGVEVNIWATPAQPAASLDFSLDIATRTIEFLEEYFDTPYPLPKSDHVALPDFSSGAMENWGLITYREVALLVDPQTTALDNKQHIATVVAHELSHQWFGNLVTMKWWNDLWLNESFANMMEYLIVDNLQPEWQIWLDHASADTISALRRDSLDGVQAIQVEVNHPDEISTLFDGAIVYAKGGRMLRMLQAYIGDELFQTALKQYFRRFAYKNTEADDLWSCMSAVSGQDIGSFMHRWLTQPGYPVVHVTKEGETITLLQEQFFIGPHGDSDKLWPIPLESSCDEMPKLLTEKSTTVHRHHTTPLRFNVGGAAHFIAHYDEVLFAQLLDSLEELPEIDRLQLLHEQTLLAQAGILKSRELIPLLEKFGDETNEAVWSIMSIAIGELRRFVETDEAAEKKLRAFVGTLARAQYERLGWTAVPGEPESDVKLRSLVIGLMTYSEDEEVLSKIHKLYKASPPEDLDPELRVIIMGAAVRYHYSPDVVDVLLEAHQKTHSNELQEDIASALCSAKDESTIKRLISLFKDTSVIRPQDFIRWFIWLMRNRYGRSMTWLWARENWSWLQKTFKGDMHFDEFPRYVASCLLTARQLEEYKKFFEPMKSMHGLRRNIEIGIGELTHRVNLIERDGPSVRQALLDLEV